MNVITINATDKVNIELHYVAVDEIVIVIQ